jgi:hypothetical protein
MKLRRLSATVLLICVLGLAAFPSATGTLACTQPLPGQIEWPPCAVTPDAPDTPTITSTTSGDMSAPADDETPLTETAAKVLLTFLTLF